MSELTHRERINLALDFKETDRSPRDLGGGIDTQHLLPFKGSEEVRQAVFQTRKTLGPGYILSSVHNIQGAIPPENIEAMLTA